MNTAQASTDLKLPSIADSIGIHVDAIQAYRDPDLDPDWDPDCGSTDVMIC